MFGVLFSQEGGILKEKDAAIVEASEEALGSEIMRGIAVVFVFVLAEPDIDIREDLSDQFFGRSDMRTRNVKISLLGGKTCKYSHGLQGEVGKITSIDLLTRPVPEPSEICLVCTAGIIERNKSMFCQ
jgi:hypothetical protein